MNLVLDVRLQRGALNLDVQLTVPAGETVALVGPNGAGKSTLLAAIAGLLPLANGRIALGDEVFDAGDGAPVPPEARGVGVVFQDLLLFPHRTVLDNVTYGLRSRGHGRRGARSLALGWLQRAGAAELAG
ncbi:MAG: ATP-binding cassette domain-containing protein, partial [Planctomycetota bacterium]